ncbi:hypothetical protein EJB05_44621, partial [Eragrostis curvula]
MTSSIYGAGRLHCNWLRTLTLSVVTRSNGVFGRYLDRYERFAYTKINQERHTIYTGSGLPKDNNPTSSVLVLPRSYLRK